MRSMIALVLATAIGFTAISTTAAAGGPPAHAPKPSPQGASKATVVTGWQLSGGAKGQKSFQRSMAPHGKQSKR